MYVEVGLDHEHRHQAAAGSKGGSLGVLDSPQPEES